MPFSIFFIGLVASVTFYNLIYMFFRNHRIHRISEMLTFPWVYEIEFVIDFATEFAIEFVSQALIYAAMIHIMIRRLGCI